MVITDPILTDLGYVQVSNEEIDLLNFYKSFPITCRARLKELCEGSAVFYAQPPGSICLQRGESTILLSNRLLEAVKAKVDEFSIQTGMVVLSNFEYVGSRLGDRMVARVEPKDRIEVIFKKEGTTFTGHLLDISLSGIGVATSLEEISRGDGIEVSITLPEGTILLPVKVLEVTSYPQHQRLSLKFNTKVTDIAVVYKYITHRRSEIFEEIQEKYSQAVRQSK
jgi:hypothetical protein